MQLTIISDTHGKHSFLKLGRGDVLIHCGDFSSYGDLDEVADFAEFIGKQNFKHKIVIAGNHDWSFEDDRREQAEGLLLEQGIIYLNGSGIELEGMHFWGSPIQPEFCHWAFNLPRGAALAEHWLTIPTNTDVLITHTPPYGILDTCYDGRNVGCEDLLEAVKQIQPKVHAFGHIHESHGTQKIDNTLFVNASSLDEKYRFANSAIVVTL